MRSPADWRLILGDGGTGLPGGGAGPLGGTAGARNMAVDQALLASVQDGGRPTLRLYCWDPPCLSLGRNQHAAGLYDEDRAAANGIDIVRRPTGGLAVLHDRELTYCLLAPARALGGARTAYASINRALVDGLRALGVDAQLAARGPARRPVADAADPCFRMPAEGEVVAAGRKLVGSAQRCERGALLQHGSILLDGTQAAVTDLLVDRADARGADAWDTHARDDAPDADRMAAGGADVRGAAARNGVAQDPGSITLRELLGREVAPGELAERLQDGVARRFGIRLAPDSMTREERARADGFETLYRTAAWTWRR